MNSFLQSVEEFNESIRPVGKTEWHLGLMQTISPAWITVLVSNYDKHEDVLYLDCTEAGLADYVDQYMAALCDHDGEDYSHRIGNLGINDAERPYWIRRPNSSTLTFDTLTSRSAYEAMSPIQRERFVRQMRAFVSASYDMDAYMYNGNMLCRNDAILMINSKGANLPVFATPVHVVEAARLYGMYMRPVPAEDVLQAIAAGKRKFAFPWWPDMSNLVAREVALFVRGVMLGKDHDDAKRAIREDVA